jgi:hypothetical protein
VVAVVGQQQKFLIFLKSGIELASTFNNSIGNCRQLLTLPSSSAITRESIVLSQDHSNFAVLLQ